MTQISLRFKPISIKIHRDMEEGQLRLKFREIFQSSPEILSSAPGRINIIGEHTDYNHGYVLPAAIHRCIRFLAGRRADDQVRIWTANFGEKSSFSLKKMSLPKEHHWNAYIKGVYWVLSQYGYSPGGIDCLIWGNIPTGSGLSSSAALEVSVVNGLDHLFSLGIMPLEKAKIAQKAENDFVGIKCGLMDQFISIFGEEERAIFLDCQTFEFEKIPIELKKKNLEFLVYDSCVKRELSLTEYNTRRLEATAAERFLRRSGLPGYRGVSLDELSTLKDKMEKILYKRAWHVISENERVHEAREALKKHDFSALGQLLFQSHISLRDDYEVSCSELDLLYEFGQEFSGCLGARLTGAGFGGSGIALIKSGETDRFTREILDLAQKKGYRKPKVFSVKIDKGARHRFYDR